MRPPLKSHNAAAIADLTADLQLLLVVPDRLAGVAEGIVGVPQVAEGVALAAAVADLAGGGQGGLQPCDPLAGVQAQVDIVTGAKTVLSYLMKPVIAVRESAFRER